MLAKVDPVTFDLLNLPGLVGSSSGATVAVLALEEPELHPLPLIVH